MPIPNKKLPSHFLFSCNLIKTIALLVFPESAGCCSPSAHPHTLTFHHHTLRERDRADQCGPCLPGCVSNSVSVAAGCDWHLYRSSVTLSTALTFCQSSCFVLPIDFHACLYLPSLSSSPSSFSLLPYLSCSFVVAANFRPLDSPSAVHTHTDTHTLINSG